MEKIIEIAGRKIGGNNPTFIIAELSGNHNQSYERAIQLIDAAKKAGADAVKLQTYTPDTITIDCDNKYFQITQETIWDGTTLHKLYRTAYTPWEWQPRLKEYAESLGLICFSSPFDLTSVDFLEKMNVPAYKIASFEINDIPFIEKIAKLQKPIIISTGIAYMSDIEEALDTCKKQENNQVILLKCASSYPTPYEDINLKTIPNMKDTFDCIVGLSDHTMGYEVALGAVALGAKVIEKHMTLKRSDGGPDSAFSMETQEFEQMVKSIRNLEAAMGKVTYDLTYKQKKSREHSRSLFVVKDIKKGEMITEENVRSIRPGFGMHTRYYKEVLGKTVNQDLVKGTPLEWGYLK